MEKIITESCILFDNEATSKTEIIEALSHTLLQEGRINDQAEFVQVVLAREAELATTIGYQIGLPHGKTNCVITPTIGIARLMHPLVWNEATGETVNVVIMIAVPKEEEGSTHLQLLAKIARKLMHEDFRSQLLLSEDKQEIVQMINIELEG